MVRVSYMDMTLTNILVMGLAFSAMADENQAFSNECPKGNLNDGIVQLPHETDCTKYYVCVESEKVERECPIMDENENKLHYNSELGVCDWPENANCQLLLRSIRISSAAENVTIPTECPKVDSTNETVHLAHETDCTKFYTCSAGQKYEMDCPVDTDGNNLHFNAILQVCDWPWNANCELPLPIMGISPTDVVIPTECPEIDSSNETVHLAHETDCTKFYMCENGKKHLRECPVIDDEGNRLYFNVAEQVCDWPWNVDCKQTQSTLKITSFIVRAEIPTECPANDMGDHSVQLAHEYDCTKFYACSHGEKYLQSCPPMNANGDRLYFDPVSQVCVWPSDSNCEPSSSDTTTTFAPTTTTVAPTTTTVAPTTTTVAPTTTTVAPTTTTLAPTTTTIAPTTTTLAPTTTTVAPTTTTVAPTTTTVAPTTTTVAPTTTTVAPTTTTVAPTTTTVAPTTTTVAPTTTTVAPTTTTVAPTTTTVAPTTTTVAPTTTTVAPTTTTVAPTTTTVAPITTTTVQPALGCIGTCPNEDPPNKITALPNADCKKWCRCENREIKVFVCPGHLYFSPTEHKCTTKEKSGCIDANLTSRSPASNEHDEALMNILGYNDRFRL